MSDVVETPELMFRRLFREDWAKFLQSPMGILFVRAMYSQRPMAAPSNIPSQDSHKLGQILNFDLMMNFLAVNLCSNLTSPASEPEQNYPDDPNNPTNPDQEKE